MNFNGPRFVIGVTGHMLISAEDADKAKASVESLLQWLTADPGTQMDSAWQEKFGKPLGLPSSAILVLTSLAPGVDQIAADVCLSRGVELLCPLPFPHSWSGTSTDPAAPVFRNSTSFVQGDSEDHHRQQKYDDLVAKIGEQNLFPVKRLCDRDLSDDQLAERLKADLNNPDERDLRYRAAGENIAANCDVLLAICDRLEWHPVVPVGPGSSPETQPGSSFVVESRLRGTTPGLLPDRSSLTWADNGPVIRVFVRNQRRPDDSPEGVTPLEVWHPEDSTPGYLESHHWHRHEMNQLRLFATQIRKAHELYNSAVNVDPEAVQQELLPAKTRKVFVPGTFSRWCIDGICWALTWMKTRISRKSQPQPIDPPAAVPMPQSRLQQIARLYSVTAGIADAADGKVKSLRRSYLWAAGWAVVMLQMSEQFGPDVADASAHGWMDVMRWIFVLVSVGLIFVAFLRHFAARKNETESTQNEYRALAEALRIQFYWSAAGTGQLVSQHYLQRQRSDLSWIRAAVGSMLIPASRDEQDFQSLSTKEQIQTLEQVHRGWIGGQRLYFEKTAWRLGNRKHWLHFWKTVFMTAGLLLMLAGIVVHLTHQELLFKGLSAYWGIWAPVHVVGLLLFVFVALQVMVANTWRHLESDRLKLEDSSAVNSIVVQESLNETTRWWMQNCDKCHHVIQSKTVAIPFGILMAISVVALAFSGQVPESWFSAPVKLVNFWRNIFLTIAALIHAASAFSFLAQNVPRYQTMRGLYQGADCRWLLLRNLMTRPDATPEQVKQAIQHTQSYLIDLGIESLNENSEWLLMHRVTPTNPVIPAG